MLECCFYVLLRLTVAEPNVKRMVVTAAPSARSDWLKSVSSILLVFGKTFHKKNHLNIDKLLLCHVLKKFFLSIHHTHVWYSTSPFFPE